MTKYRLTGANGDVEEENGAGAVLFFCKFLNLLR